MNRVARHPITITRFQVKALLQTARARKLGLNLKEAKSWGLNRALFYAAAKKGWQIAKAKGSHRPIIPEFESAQKLHEPVNILVGKIVV